MVDVKKYVPEHGDVVKVKSTGEVGRVHSISYHDDQPNFVRIHTVGEKMDVEILTVPVDSVAKL